MSYQIELQDAVKVALKAGEKEKLLVLRGLLAAIKQREIDERITLSDDDVLVILDKQVKQRKDAIAQFASANRQDLVDKEQAEIDIIITFMPQPLSEADIAAAVDAALASVGESNMAAMGKIMAILKPQLQGRADLAAVSQQIKNRLN